MLTGLLKYQHLADKYAPSDPEISNILAKLQLPPELKVQSVERATFVPLPSRMPLGSKQQIAEAVRDGRKVTQQLAAVRGWTASSELGQQRSVTETSASAMKTSPSDTLATTVFEKDFTVPGKKSQLLCPFAAMQGKSGSAESKNEATQETTGNGLPQANDPHAPIHPPDADPICAALYTETHHSPPPSVTDSAAKCPIRYLDQHSPEDIAKYFATHKHEIPRSHEICVKRYQRSEEDIRKLDAKYGSIVNMISGLGQKHQPILQVKDGERRYSQATSFNNVGDWAKAISAEPGSALDAPENANPSAIGDEEERQGHFDRPLREIRVGESPSRPWGISVPLQEEPPASEVPELPNLLAEEPKISEDAMPSRPAGQCPFSNAQKVRAEAKVVETAVPSRPAGKCPFGHGQASGIAQPPIMTPQVPQPADEHKAKIENPVPQPIFMTSPNAVEAQGAKGPQMVFTGPVFIGYPTEQAMAILQQWQAGATAGGKQ